MSDKSKIILSVISVVISTALLAISAFLAENAAIRPLLATVFIFVSVILVFVAIYFAAKIDYEMGIYECKKCGNVFKPSFMAYFFGVHTLTTRHLKCPKCGKKSLCKRKT